MPRSQPSLQRLICAIAVSSVFVTVIPATADAADAGQIAGHVVRGKGGRPLVGATVSVKETGTELRSGPDGGFVFEGLAPGSYTVTVLAEGTNPVEKTVTIAAGGGATADFALEDAIGALETVVVESQSVPYEVARGAQQEALNLVSLTTAEEIRKLPDVNAAEAVKRLPGVTLETDTGEGRFIYIRGLDADLNSTTFGGLRLPPSNPQSPQGSGRAVAYDAIPTGLIGALTLTKSNLPEMDAEALGGTIEITPKTAPRSGKPFVEGHVGTGNEVLRDTKIKDFSVTGGTRFGFGGVGTGDDKDLVAYRDRPFSIVVTASYYEDKRGIDDLEAGYLDSPPLPGKAFSSVDQRYYTNYNRKRHGYGFDLGFEPDARNKYYLRAFDAGYTETVNRQILTWNFDGNASVSPTNPALIIDTVNAGGWNKTLRDEKERTNDRVITAGGENKFDGYTVDYRLGYTRGAYDKFYDNFVAFTYVPTIPTTVTYNNITDPNYPSFTAVGASPYTWSNYTLSGVRNSTETLSDREYTLAGDIAIPTHFTKFEDERIKAGVSARLRKRSDVQPSVSLPSANFPNPALTLPAFQSGGDNILYSGRYDVGPAIDAGKIRTLMAGLALQGDPNLDLTTATSGDENVYAGYGQYEFGFGPLSLVGGLRMEDTRATYDSNAAILKSDGTIDHVVPVSQSTNYVNFFPSLQARYALREDLIGRGAFSSTLARPGFQQVSGGLSISPSTNSVTEGNPDLKPTKANSIEFSIEHYLPNGGIMSAAIFDKEISNYIARVRTTQTFANNTGLFKGFNGPVAVTTYVNIPDSRSWGAELNYEQRYRALPGWLGGFGTSVNYTYVDSEAQFRPGRNQTLPSSSRNTANASIFYEKYGFTGRLGAYYVSRSLWAFGGYTQPQYDVFSEARTEVDFGASYMFVKGLSVYFDAKNITNAPLKFTEGTSDRPIQREYYRPTYQFGLQFSY